MFINKLIVQACAILIVTGIVVPELSALPIPHPAASSGEANLCVAGNAIPLPESQGYACTGISPEGRSVGDAFREEAAGQVFGAPRQSDTPMQCTIDPETMCITWSSRVYPIIPGGRSTLLGDIASRIRETDTSVPTHGSLILTGLGLIALSVLAAFVHEQSLLAAGIPVDGRRLGGRIAAAGAQAPVR